MIVHVFGRTDVGRTREHNEDAFVVADLTRGNATLQPEVRTHEVGDRGTLFMVADGMGGAAAGEIASAMAIEVVLRELNEALSAVDAPDKESYALALKRATAVANTQIHSFALGIRNSAAWAPPRPSPAYWATRCSSRRWATAERTSCAMAWRGRSQKTNR